MKFLIATVLATTAFVAASPIVAVDPVKEPVKEPAKEPEIPECAKPCFEEAIRKVTSCEVTDKVCACANQKEIGGAATGCVISKCGIADALGKVKPAAEKMCKKINEENKKRPKDDEKPNDGEKPTEEKTTEEKPTEEKPTEEKPTQ